MYDVTLNQIRTARPRANEWKTLVDNFTYSRLSHEFNLALNPIEILEVIGFDPFLRIFSNFKTYSKTFTDFACWASLLPISSTCSHRLCTPFSPVLLHSFLLLSSTLPSSSHPFYTPFLSHSYTSFLIKYILHFPIPTPSTLPSFFHPFYTTFFFPQLSLLQKQHYDISSFLPFFPLLLLLPLLCPFPSFSPALSPLSSFGSAPLSSHLLVLLSYLFFLFFSMLFILPFHFT